MRLGAVATAMAGRRSDLRMRIDAVVDESVARVGPEATLGEIGDAMISGSRCGRYVVVEGDDGVVGILTDRDLIARTLTTDGEASLLAGASAEAITAADLMTPEPLTVSPDDEIPRVLRRMNEATARHVPVVEGGTTISVVSLDDLVRHVAGESAHVAAQLDNLAGVIREESERA